MSEGEGGPIRTAYLGRYDEFEVPVVIDILRDHGIVAVSKDDLTEADHSPYGAMMSDRGVVLVDAERVHDAKRILEDELPAHLESIRLAMEDLEQTGDGRPPGDS